jgi:CPA2 family monovalent cation:H+ antiporter-2
MGISADLTVVILAGFCGGVLARLARQPLVLGYLLAGVALGPYAGTLIHDAHNLELLAELGVTLLLFGLGLELSMRELAPVRRVALLGTAAQMLLTTALGWGIARALGLAHVPAVWFGALVSLSSTMVVLKTLQAQGRIGTLSSRVMVGMLIAQDLAVIPLMIVLPQLAADGAGAGDVGRAVAQAAVLLALIGGVSFKVLPLLLERVARSGSRELFLLTITALALGIGYFTQFFGLSPALGAFVAGLALSESDYSHQALSDIIPLRDVLSVLFFASVGMLLDPVQLLASLPLVLTVVLAVSVGKGLIFAGVTRAFGYRNVVPLATGLGLFQVGEFSFVLARAGLSSGSIPSDLYALVLNTALVTMALTPVVSGLTSPLYAWTGRRRPREPVRTMNVPDAGLRDHVIIAGAGRVGSSIAAVLARLQLPVVLVELDTRQVDQVRRSGVPVVFGDAAQPTVLEAAGVSTARLVLVTVPGFTDARSIVLHAQRLNPAIPVVARAEGLEALDALRALGVEEAVQPETEAGLEMTRQALLHLRVPPMDILQVTDELRQRRYGPAGSAAAADGRLTATLAAAARLLDLRWVRLAPGSRLTGRTIGDLGVRTSLGVSVVGVFGDGRFVANPGPGHRLDADDLVAVVGGRDQLAAFEREAAPGALD